MTQRSFLSPTQHGYSLRRASGGRLRSYRPKRTDQTRLEAIRKALVRGELALNGFNRWRLLRASTVATGWTFTDVGQTAEVAQSEIKIAQRESGELHVLLADESTAEDALARIDVANERPQLLVARRDWGEHPSACPPFCRMLEVARKHRLVVHVVAALGSNSSIDDEFRREAQLWQIRSDPLFRPPLCQSKIELRFGKALSAAGLSPVPQKPVAQYFLDFAISGTANGLPVRLDIEVDGRHWHEELPNVYRLQDKLRDQTLVRFGWRPVRFWTDAIERDETGCIKRIAEEAASPVPLSRKME